MYGKDGEVVRVRPMQVPEEEYKPWTIEAGGKKYSPPRALRIVLTPANATGWIRRTGFSIR